MTPFAQRSLSAGSVLTVERFAHAAVGGRLKLALRSVVCALVCFAGSAFAASVPAWTLNVPSPAATCTSSALDSITSDAAGNAFVVINLINSVIIVGNTPTPTPAGTQLFLLNSKGKVTATAEFTNIFSVVPLQVSARKVIASTSQGLVQFSADKSGALIATNLATETVGESLVLSNPANFDFKYVHSTLLAGDFISTIKRYSLIKLKP